MDTGNASPMVAGSEWPDGTGMIYLGMSRWEGMWKSRHQLMSRFSKLFPVLYVEPWVSLQSMRTGRTRPSRIIRDVFKSSRRSYSPNVTVLTGSALRPVSGAARLRELTRNRWLRSIRKAAGSAGILHQVLWICRPEMGFAVGRLGEQLSVYHMVDEYTGYTGLSESEKERISAQEAQVLACVDLSIAASPELVNAKMAPGRNILLLENGVSARRYREARKAGAVPSDIDSLPRPRLGYSGLIGKRLDLKLLTNVAEARKDWSLVMIGKIDERECEAELARLRSLANVHFLGEKRPEQVASYINALDVGLLPYAINLETQHISPIKMYEYWAAGKPVVSTNIPAARRHDTAVYIANSSRDFIELLEKSLGQFDDADRRVLIQLAEANSWQTRVDQVSRELTSRLAAR